MIHEGKSTAAKVAHIADEEASEAFIQRLYGEWTPENQTACEARLERDPRFAQAWRRLEENWQSLDRHAEAPEIVTYRAHAIAEMRRANARRWYRSGQVHDTRSKWKIAMAGLVLFGGALQLSPYGLSFLGMGPGQYRTGIGEQRIVELADHSRVTMDAATQLQIRFSNESRTVRLLEGQAQFSVAKDPGRPFKVLAGDRTVVAVGTVFTVEYVDRKIHVTMLEGKVAVLAPRAPDTGSPDVGRAAAGKQDASMPDEDLYLTSGEELRVAHNRTVVTPEADLEAATAWREGKVIFRTEPLGEAVSRMNRYSRLQLQVDDPTLASKQISGVFEAGDTRGFVNALESYLPVTADYADSGTIRLKAR